MSNCFQCDKPIKSNEVHCVDCSKPMHSECAAHCIKCGKVLCDLCALNNRFKCAECLGATVGGIEIEKVRRSNIDLYDECAHAFYLNVVKGIEQPGNAYSEVGVELHDIFDRNSQGEFGPRVGGAERAHVLIQEWDRRFAEIPEDKFVGCQSKLTIESFKRKLYEQGVRNIQNYLNWESTRPDPWKTEETLVDWIDNDTSLPKVQMTMDRIDLVNGEYEVLDYKTGKVFVGKNLAHYLQTPLYILMIEKIYGIKVSRFRYLFFNENKERVFERRDDDTFVCTVGKREYTISLQETVKRVKRTFAKIKRGQFNIPPNVSDWKCKHMCQMYKAGACQGKETQSWINKNNMI